MSAIITGDTIIIPNQHMQGKIIFGTGYVYTTPAYGTFGSISMSYEVIDSATGIVDDFGNIQSDLSAPSEWNK